jgi:hypothetical protein
MHKLLPPPGHSRQYVLNFACWQSLSFASCFADAWSGALTEVLAMNSSAAAAAFFRVGMMLVILREYGNKKGLKSLHFHLMAKDITRQTAKLHTLMRILTFHIRCNAQPPPLAFNSRGQMPIMP